ncbi:hypothetical protein [Aerococcus kribbianus]|uniref:Uncharacterized protein n=1 Tax=Aerococcus kribbianus TaxID=2999064 RepID=A0A9X3FNJ4_9LACT|nr:MULTISPECIES: hypothetical protein [unclassified Aerococcus]MCZ0717564.1 hypothetical protein [Aerococcus sp. YH-aer221]MCZ0725852.1 hypothetical protein [Aerococcus sp. YH-aer222]
MAEENKILFICPECGEQFYLLPELFACPYCGCRLDYEDHAAYQKHFANRINHVREASSEKKSEQYFNAFRFCSFSCGGCLLALIALFLVGSLLITLLT